MQNRDTKVYVWTSTRQRIVCSASKVTICSSVYQTCQVVVNSMLHQQGDNTLIMYQSCHATATVKQDDSHYIVFSASNVTTCSSVNRTCQVIANSMLRQQGDSMLIIYQSCYATATVKQDDSHYIVFSASNKVTTCSSVNRTCQVVANSMLRQQGDNMLIISQSCHAIAKRVDSQYK